MRPITDKQATAAIKWLDACFGEEVNKAVKSPFTASDLYGIVCQETAYFWLQFLGRLTPSDVVARCVLDGSGDVAGTTRRAFPSNTAEFTRKYGRAFTEILVKEGNKTRVLRGLRPWGKIYKGYGIFQYDLQFVQTDEFFFREKQWYLFNACLFRCLEELDRTYERHGTVHEAIRAYNGAGPRAREYAVNVIHYSNLADDVLAETHTN
jgi:hypothetical protein